MLREAADAMRLTARGYHRVMKIARTLADLDGEGRVGRIHLAEALPYRTARISGRAENFDEVSIPCCHGRSTLAGQAGETAT